MNNMAVTQKVNNVDSPIKKEIKGILKNKLPKTDPVAPATAVVESNVTEKKPVIKCVECKLEFTSQVVMDAHLQGSRHAKQVCHYLLLLIPINQLFINVHFSDSFQKYSC